MWGVGGQVGPIKSNQNGFAIDCVLSKELAVSVLELADLGWVEDTDLAVGPIEPPLVGFRIVNAQGQTFDVAGGAVEFNLVDGGAIINLAADTGPVKFDPGSGTGQGMQAALQVIFPSTY